MSRRYFERDYQPIDMPLDYPAPSAAAAERRRKRLLKNGSPEGFDQNSASDITTGTEDGAGNHEEKDTSKDVERDDKVDKESEGDKMSDDTGMPPISAKLSKAKTEVNTLKKATTKRDTPIVAVDCAILIRHPHAQAEALHCLFINRGNTRFTVSSVARSWKGVTYYGFPVHQNIPDFWMLEKLETRCSEPSTQPGITFLKPHRRISDFVFIPGCQPVGEFKKNTALDSKLDLSMLGAGSSSGSNTDRKLDPERSKDTKSKAAETVEAQECSTENPHTETKDSTQDGHDEASSKPVTGHWAEFSKRFSKLALIGDSNTKGQSTISEKESTNDDKNPSSKKKKLFRPMVYQLVFIPDKACSLVVNGHLASALFHTIATSAAFRLRMLEDLWRRVEDRGVSASDRWLFHEERRLRLMVDIVSVYPVQRIDHLWNWYVRVQVNKRVLLERSLAWLTSKRRQFAFLPEYFACHLDKISVRETARLDRPSMTDVRHLVSTTQGQRERTAWTVFKAFSCLHGQLPSKAFVLLLQPAMSDVKQDMTSPAL